MGSKTFSGVWFQSFSHDHAPPHVHGSYGETLVIVELLSGGKVREADRWNAVTPRNAKRSDVRRILNVAAANWTSLWVLWEATHGPASK